MGQAYLYVSNPLGEPGTSKVGFTTQAPRRRNRQLGGQTTQSFELRQVQPVPLGRGRQAEQLLHALLEAAGVKRVAGPRKEQFRVAPEEVRALMKAAAKGVRLLHKDEVSPSDPRSADPRTSVTFPKKGVWPLAASYPVTLGGRTATLAQLMARVPADPASVRRLSRMGFELCRQPAGALEFIVCWNSAKLVAEWVRQHLGENTPLELPPRLRVKIAD